MFVFLASLYLNFAALDIVHAHASVLFLWRCLHPDCVPGEGVQLIYCHLQIPVCDPILLQICFVTSLADTLVSICTSSLAFLVLSLQALYSRCHA